MLGTVAAGNGGKAESACAEGSITVLLSSKGKKLWRKLMLLPLSVRKPLRKRHLKRGHNKHDLPPAASPAESNQVELPEEDRRRNIGLVIAYERTESTENRVERVREDKILNIAVAYFDFNFNEGPGIGPFILVNRSLLPDVDLEGWFKKYDDPENPPIVLKNPDGTKMKLLGEFSAKWCPHTTSIEKYAGQQIFLNPCKHIRSRCVVVPEASPYDVLVGLGTIKEHDLDVSVTTVATSEGKGTGQGGKHDGGPPVNPVAVKNKQPVLEADRITQTSLQHQIEETKERNRRATSVKQ